MLRLSSRRTRNSGFWFVFKLPSSKGSTADQIQFTWEQACLKPLSVPTFFPATEFLLFTTRPARTTFPQAKTSHKARLTTISNLTPRGNFEGLGRLLIDLTSLFYIFYMRLLHCSPHWESTCFQRSLRRYQRNAASRALLQQMQRRTPSIIAVTRKVSHNRRLGCRKRWIPRGRRRACESIPIGEPSVIEQEACKFTTESILPHIPRKF